MIIVGHRGARNEAPENTVAGFVHAQRNGCVHFELDIQLTRDHELVVFHDTSLKRTTGMRRKVTMTNYDVVKGLDARLNAPFWPTPCPVPSLQDVVDSVPHTRHWQFEVKTDSRHILTILAKHLDRFIRNNDLHDKVTITSGDRWFLSHLRDNYPHYERGYVAEYPLPEPVGTAEKLQCSYLILNHHLASEHRVSKAIDAGMHVSCWTVNSVQRMTHLKQIGVHSLITDIPSTALTHPSLV